MVIAVELVLQSNVSCKHHKNYGYITDNVMLWQWSYDNGITYVMIAELHYSSGITSQ